MKKPSNISRRSFLKGAAASALGVAAFGVMGKNEVAAEESAQPAAPIAAKYEVINSDLVIIGAGYGAFMAAFQAVAKNKRVTIIDKAPFRHGGGAGYNWDLISTWIPDKQYYKDEAFLNYGVNQELFKKASEDDPFMDMGTQYVNWGQNLPQRNDDGSLKYYVQLPFNYGVEGVFPRLTLDELVKSPLVTIVDRTMVTDLMVSDGKCLGAVGLYLPTGDVRVFRGAATIMATGPATWLYGWTGVSAYSIGTPDNTGDPEMAAYRHGASIGDSEYAAYDFASTYPNGLGFGWGTMLNPDANEYMAFADKDGKQLITEENGIDLVRITYDRNYFNTNLAKLMLGGAMTEDGGLVANLDGVHLRTAISYNLPVFESFGVDPLKERMPIHDEIYERGGAPVIDSNMMSEDIAGLFCVRGAGVMGSGGGSCAVLNQRFGSYAMRKAIEYIDSTEPIENIDFSSVEAEYARLHEIRNREIEGGLRPCEVRHRIQKACGTCMGILRETAKLETALAELKRIRDEDMPKMILATKTQTYNTEWKEAIENYNLLDAALLAVEATLMRTETRGTYLRPDYPEMDNENWNCMLTAKKVDGKAVFAKKVMPTVEW